MSKCEMCERGPRGIEGHLDLFVLEMEGAQPRFKCRTCRCVWVRNTTAGGALVWTVLERAGQVLGRSPLRG
jgi:hypothetical protein